MITIIHGTNTASSRKYFIGLRQNEPDQTIIDGKNVSLTDLVQIFEGGDLFTEQKNFFIEELFGKKSRGAGKKDTEQKAIHDYIEKQSGANNIFIWEGSELSKTNLNTFKNPAIKAFKLPQALFLFLESIKPRNGKALIKLFHEVIDTADTEMVFFMMVRQIRMLLGLIEPTTDGIDEIKRMAPWQRTKLQNQADRFETSELIQFYNKLFKIEKAMKTGNLGMSLTETIDFLLLDI